MEKRKRRRSDRAGRPAMRSPGRPRVAGRAEQQRFWKAIARGLSSEEAAVSCGVSSPVGGRWFREGGGMPPISLAPPSARYLCFAEREEIALVHNSIEGRWCMKTELARNDPHPEAPHLPISYDSGPPRSVIRFRMLHASSASALCPPGVRARRPVPMIDLYLKKAFFQPREPADGSQTPSSTAVVDDEVHGFAPWDSTKGELEVLAAPRERRPIGRGQIEAHQTEERRQEPLGLAEGQGEDEPDRQRRFNREVGGTTTACPAGRPPRAPRRRWRPPRRQTVTSPRRTRARS